MALTPPEVRESQARAALEKPPATIGPLTNVQDRARRIREEVAKKGPLDAAKEFVASPLPNKGERAESMNNRLGWEKGADGKKVRTAGSPEAIIFDNAKLADVVPSDFVEKGYDALGPAQALVKAQVELALRERIPDLADTLLGTTAAPSPEKDQILESIARDPRYRDLLRITHKARLESDVIKTTDEQIEAAKKRAAEATQADTEKGTEVTDLTTERGTNQTKLDRFDAGGADRIRLDQLRRDTPKTEAAIARLEPQIEHLQTQLAQLRDTETRRRLADGPAAPGVIAVQTEISARDAELKTALTNLHKQQGYLQERDTLTTEEARLKTEKTRLDGAVKTAEREKNETLTQKLEAEAAFQSLKNSRATEEAAYLSGIKDSIKDAGAAFVEEKLKEAQTVETAVLQAEAATTTDADKKKMLNRLSTAGLSVDKKGHLKIDKARSLDLGGRIIKPAIGLDNFMQGWLTEGVANPSEEYDRLIEKMKDKAFITEMRGKIGPTLIGRYIKAGGKFTEGDAEYLRGTEWGQDLIKNGIEATTKGKTEFDEMVAGGVVDKSFFDRLKSVDNKTWLKVLLLALGGAVALAGVGPVAAIATGVGGKIAGEGLI